MVEPVKTRRYDNSLRVDAARRTRRGVVAAALDLFVELGYPATTLGAIAARAGVSVQTVYGQFGNKISLLKEVVDQTVAGDDEPTPMRERAWVQRLIEEPDPRAKLAIQAAGVTQIMRRTYQLDQVLRGAAGQDPDAEALWRKGSEQRHAGMTEFATHLRQGGHLRKDLSVAAAADRLATLIDPENYRLTVVDRQWSSQAYEDWLLELMSASLLPPGDAVTK